MALNPSPQRQEVVTFPTPNVNDILFFESVDASRIGTDIPDYGSSHPDHVRWPNHKLVYVETADPNSQNRYYRYYYASDQLEQDDDNWSYTEADIGGTKFDAVARDYIVKRTDFDPDSPAMGSAMPDVPEGKFEGAYVLAQKRQTPINDKVLNGLYVTEQRVYVKRVPMYRLDWDEFFGKTNYTKQTLYYKDEIPEGYPASPTIAELSRQPNSLYWRLSERGILRTLQQLSENWFAVTEQQVVNTGEGPTPVAGFSYNSTVNFKWPAVLADENPIVAQSWEMKSGGVRTYPDVTYAHGAYNGPSKSLVEVSWGLNPASGSEVGAPPDPKPVLIQTPLFTVSIPPCLHNGINFVVGVGTEDETWKQTVYTYDDAATEPSTWEAFNLSSKARPFRGGFLLETIRVFPPVDSP